MKLIQWAQFGDKYQCEDNGIKNYEYMFGWRNYQGARYTTRSLHKSHSSGPTINLYADKSHLTTFSLTLTYG